ncbi:FAD-dependent oxidoreductase [Streptomyces sp. M19]
MTAARPGATPSPVFDVAVVGGGVVGSAIARELCGHELSVALVEARDDVGDGTSKANTAILHTGFDATPAPSNHASSAAATTCCPRTPRPPASPSNAPGPCWWPGTTRNSPRSRR